jgi:N-acetylmuramoyl-L-alanine amidase
MVQAGHNAPRQPGFESGTGTVGEIDFVKRVADALLALLKADPRFEGVYQPGWIQDSSHFDAALFLHADGAGPTATGYSFGYQTAAGKRLSVLIAEEFEKVGHPASHRADNYTPDEHYYYGFGHTDGSAEVLIEHGFMTNPSERKWLESHVSELAKAEYRALCRFFGLSPQRRMIGYRVSWIAKSGDRVSKNISTPWVWAALHRGSFQRGKVIFSRRFEA